GARARRPHPGAAREGLLRAPAGRSRARGHGAREPGRRPGAGARAGARRGPERRCHTASGRGRPRGRAGMSSAVSLAGVRKQYPGFELGPIDLEVEQGTALALIGPNGAGKTTLMDLIGGALAPSAGRIEVLGRDATGTDPSWKASVGYAGEQPFFERWTARANLRFLAGFYPAWSVAAEERLVEQFALPVEKRVKALSRGNRVKLQLVAALARQPRLLLLDEPTAGLDPLVRNEVLGTLWDLLEDEGITLVYSTHILSDVDRLADELAFIRDGR